MFGNLVKVVVDVQEEILEIVNKKITE